jgi:hypothetical protein
MNFGKILEIQKIASAPFRAGGNAYKERDE